MENNDEIMYEIMRHLSCMIESDILDYNIRLSEQLCVIPPRFVNEVDVAYIVETMGRSVEDAQMLALEGELRVFEVKSFLRNSCKNELVAFLDENYPEDYVFDNDIGIKTDIQKLIFMFKTLLNSHTHCQAAQANAQTQAWQRVCLSHRTTRQ